MKTILPALLLVVTSTPAVAAENWSWTGDARGGLLGSETRNRAGATSDTTSWRARVRAGTATTLTDDWSLAARAAVRLDTRQDALSFGLDWAAPTPSGRGRGDATIDSLYLTYAPDAGAWRVRMGRFQSPFALDGVASKSLDRNDSPSFDVSWTDGVWVERRGDAWTAHVILQHNDASGPTNALRAPLAFDDGASRVGAYFGLAGNAPVGPFVQRMLGVTWLPRALAPFGVGHAVREDYWAVTAKMAAEWETPVVGTQLLLAGEIGYAPVTPGQTVMGSGHGDAGGIAWQTSANLLEVFPSHSVGVVYGRVADGWLVSPDFTPNEWLLEARWLWRYSATLAFDARVRRRSEIDVPFAALHPRRVGDFYVRATWRF